MTMYPTLRTVAGSGARLTRASLALGLSCLAALGGCGSEQAGNVDVETAQLPIRSGSAPGPQAFRIALLTHGTSICTGTFISPFWVLTARHCVETAESITVSSAVAASQIDWLEPHPSLDISLVHLRSPIGTANTELSALLPSVGATVQVYGYGANGADGTGGGTLRMANLPVAGVFPSTFTIAPNAANQFTMSGDSGSPSFDANGRVLGVHIGTVAGNSNLGLEISSSAIASWLDERLRGFPNDFSRDNHPDILWHNDDTGVSEVWSVDASNVFHRQNILSNDGLGPNVGPPWHPVGSNDFNHDGMTDILWHNDDSNETKLWYLGACARMSSESVHTATGAVPLVGDPWFIVGSNDFDLDGNTDILWHNKTTNETQIWYLNGATFRYAQTVLADDSGADHVGAPWHIVGTNKFDGDDYVDILWHNEDNGETQIWYMHGMGGSRIYYRRNLVVAGGGNANVGPPWHIVGTNQFGGDAKPDILWHNDTTRQTLIWYMNDYQRVTQSAVTASDGGASLVGSPWHIVNH